MAHPVSISSRQPPPERPDLAALLARVRGGCEVALADLYAATSARVFGLALRILRDRGRAEEVTVDVYSAVWQRADSFRPQRGSVLGWLLVLARSRALDRQRCHGSGMSRRDVAELARDLRSREPDPADGSGESAARVRAAVAALPRGQREAITATFFGGYSHSEAARVLDLPLGTLKTRVRAGMATLQRALLEVENER